MVREHVRKISKDTALVFSFNAVNYLCSFLIALLVAKFLGIEGLGEYSLILAFVSILGIISDFGLSTLLVRKINENKFHAKELISQYNKIKFLLSFCILVIIFMFAYLVFKRIFYPAFFIGAVLIFPRSALSTYEASLRSFLNQFYPAVLRGLNSILQLIISYLLLMSGKGLLAVLATILIMDIISAFILSAANNRVIENFLMRNSIHLKSDDSISSEGLFAAIKEGFVFFVNNFLMLSIKGFNVILLGYFSTAASVGIYSAGSRFINGVGLLSGALFNSFYPAIANVKNDFKLKINIVKKFLFYSFAIGLIITTLLFFLADVLINITFKISESVLVLKILSFTIIPVLVYTITQSFLFSLYGEKYLMKILIIAWSLNIILSIILIHNFDYAGCAAALAFTEIFLMLTQLGKFNFDVKKFNIKKVTLT